MRKLRLQAKKIIVGVIGGIVLLIGVIAIPYPGPGWLIVFIGLSILATEFTWAQNVHNYLHDKYSAWAQWLSRQSFYIRAVFWCLTCLVVVLTIWLLNGYGLINQWFDLRQDWVRSPLAK